jgi:hypothetical protein
MTWIKKNWIFICGLLGAVAITLQQFAGQSVELIPVLLAVGVAAAGWFGKNLQGQWITLAGIVGAALVTLGQVYAGVPIDWPQFIAMILTIITTTSTSGGTKLRT